MGSGPSFTASSRNCRERQTLIEDRSSSNYSPTGSLRGPGAERRNVSINMHSVRQLAKSTHIRQENSYIPHEEMSSFFRNSKFENSQALSIPSNFLTTPKICQEAVRVKTVENENISSSSMSKNVVSESIEKNVETQPMQCGNMFNLRIDLNSSAIESVELPNMDQAADEETDDKKLAEMLIALPKDIDTAPEIAPSSFMHMKTDDGGLIVDGLEVGVNGIVRSETKACENSKFNSPKNEQFGIKGFRNKLPMSERLIILCRLGQGASSIVYKALDLKDMKLVAVKMIQVFDRDKRHQMVRELGALFNLLRKNSIRISTNKGAGFQKPDKFIVDFYDAFSNLEDGVVAFIIEYMDGGSLQDIADSGGCNFEPTLASISIQALKGIQFLHESGAIHRDMKPANLLISHRGEVKVADLGIMKKLQLKPGQKGIPRTNSFVGTSTYMSPERIDGQEYSYPADVWAFGLTMHTVALGQLSINTTGGYWGILKSIRDEPAPRLPESFSPDMRDFIERCLQKEPEKRWSCKQLLNHNFLSQAVVDDFADEGFDQENAIEELKGIVCAIYSHIQQLKMSYAKNSSATSTPTSDAPGTPQHSHRIYGDLSMSAEDILYIVLFGKLKEGNIGVMINVPALSGGTAKKSAKMQLLRPKLNYLARQLHMPFDVLLREARKQCDILTTH